MKFQMKKKMNKETHVDRPVEWLRPYLNIYKLRPRRREDRRPRVEIEIGFCSFVLLLLSLIA